MKKLLVLTLAVLVVAGAARAQRITEALDSWTFGPNQPEVLTGARGDASNGAYHHLLVGTSAYFYEVTTEGEGRVEFWIYDPSKCLAAVDPGYGDNGPRWGLINPSYQAATVGISRQDWVSGCQGYSPWSTVASYSPWWFVSGLRGHAGIPWTAGWYHWTIQGSFNDITFTLHDVNYEENTAVVFGDATMTINATSFEGGWASLFGSGWKGFWLKGDMPSTGIEDISADVVGGSGAFAEFGAMVIDTSSRVSRPYQETTWGNIKALFR